MIMTYRAKDESGGDFFCYIKCNYDGYQKINHDYLDKKSAVPSTYGEVLYADYLVDPDEKAKNFLADWLAKNGSLPT